MTASVPSRSRLLDEDDLPPGVTSTQTEAEYVELLADGLFEPEPFWEDPEPRV